MKITRRSQRRYSWMDSGRYRWAFFSRNHWWNICGSFCSPQKNMLKAFHWKFLENLRKILESIAQEIQSQTFFCVIPGEERKFLGRDLRKFVAEFAQNLQFLKESRKVTLWNFKNSTKNLYKFQEEFLKNNMNFWRGNWKNPERFV